MEIAQKLSTLWSKVVKFCRGEKMITLNQEEIQLACKRFVKEQYNLDLPDPESPASGIQLKIMTNDMYPGTARIEADVEVNEGNKSK